MPIMPMEHATEQADSLQSHFKPEISPDEIESVFHLKRAQPLFQAFTALFHGGTDAVLVRILVLRELAADAESSAFTRADINLKLAYLQPESLETVLMRLRQHQLLAWDAGTSVYRVTPMARNVLAAIASLLHLGGADDNAEMGFLFSQVAGAQAMGGVSLEQLQHLLGRINDLTEEFSDAIASGSEFRLRTAQERWHTACDWVEKGSTIIHAITSDARADIATYHTVQKIGRAQSTLLNMQGMFARALNQIERQRVHLGQSGLSTTDIKIWLLQQNDLAQLAQGALELPVTPLFITPAEMIDVAETELLTERDAALAYTGLPDGQDAPVTEGDAIPMLRELDDWLARLSTFATQPLGPDGALTPLQDTLLPASFAVASYRASLLPLLGDASEATLQGATATLARLPLVFAPADGMVKLKDEHVAAISLATLGQQLDTVLERLANKPTDKTDNSPDQAKVAP